MRRNRTRRIAYLLVAVLLASDFFTGCIPNGILTEVDALDLPFVSGDVKLPTASGDVKLPTASGDVKLPTASGDVKLPTTSGDVKLPTVSGDAKLPTVSGDVKPPTVSGDVKLPTASGDVKPPVTSGDAADIIKDWVNGAVSGNGTSNNTPGNTSDVIKDLINGVASGNCTSNNTPGNTSDIKDLINGGASGNGTSNNISGNDSNALGILSGKVTNLHMTATTVDSITLSWAKCSDANWYVIRYWQTGARSTEHTIKTVGNVDTYTVTGLAQAEYVFYVIAANRQDDGELKCSPLFVPFWAAPIAKKPTGISLSNAGLSYASFAVAGLGNSDTSFYDTQAELYNASGRKLGTYTGNPDAITITDTRIKKNQFYKVRVRGTYTLADGTRQAGEWSSYKYFSVGLKNVTGSAKKTSISLSWSKVKGATSYAIYLKKSGADSYKKVKTVKAKNRSAKITKYGKKKLKKNTMYYVKVVAIYKKGNSTYKCKSQVYKVKTKK